ncbi:MAG TPA: PAS domain S-box protein [Terriglobales bacterium]|nr:PAS domain S-box protein [Terriglobales bacterium]
MDRSPRAIGTLVNLTPAMHSAKTGERTAIPDESFAGGGKMGELMRSLDWSKTPLGPVSQWPQSLKTSLSICLASRFPIVLYWGPEYVVLYNDAYSTILGSKHPWALGQRCRECWAEIWDTIGPMLDTVVRTGEATWSNDLLLQLERFGYPEECYFSFSFGPVRVETGGVGGVFTAVLETTEEVIGERRLRTLRDLAARGVDAGSEREAWRIAATTIGENPKDIPFAILCRPGAGGGLQALETVGISREHALAKELCSPGSQPFALARQAMDSGSSVTVEGLQKFAPELPHGAWEVPPRSAQLVPMATPGQGLPGVLLAGVSPHKALDESYRAFFDLVGRQIAASVADARAYEEERRRAEALAEIDRAKTLFFTNISHEFRTPLTLMLGPVENMLQSAGGVSSGVDREQLELVHRNSLRLLKLVNSLLDFSRMEASRVHAVYEPTDLAALTMELASIFRSAMERAGLRFAVECEALPEPVYVDREMWEKIVLNLLSNAFKFTFAGEVRLKLSGSDGQVELSVEDTGTGIPQDELPRIFDRFHRVEGARGRTYEGTGIGLALVHELVKLHGGSVKVESTLGRGSKFTVSLPLGKEHLPAERIETRSGRAPADVRADAYVEEAVRWLPQQSGAERTPGASAAQSDTAGVGDRRPLIVLADDNADLRAYVSRLLSQDYRVHAVANGEEALAATRKLHPDLVLTDIMMPGLDGFGLLKAIREDERTRAIPVILLSARAGEESRVEGLHTGADDYLVKPFTARELMARVDAHIRMAEVRRQVDKLEDRLRVKAELEQRRVLEFLQQVPAAIAMLRGPEHRWNYVNPAYLKVIGREHANELLGKPIRETLPELEGQGYLELLDRAYKTGQAIGETEARVRRNRGQNRKPEDAYFNFLYQPLKDITGKVEGVFVHAVDVTPQVEARRAIEESEQQFRMLAESIPQLDWMASADGSIYWYNQRWYEYTGAKPEEMVGWGWQSVRDPAVLPKVMERWQASLRSGEPFEMIFPLRGADGRFRQFLTRIVPVRDANGKVARWFGTNNDVTAQLRAEEELRESEERLRVALAASDTGTYRWNFGTGEFVEFDENLKRLFGVPADREVRQTGDFVRLVHSDDVPELLAGMERSRQGADFEMEHRVVLPDGKVRWLYNRGKAVYAKGEPVYLVGACTDTTSRKAEESARLRLAAIVESSDDAIVSKDLNGIVTSWNAAAERIFGYTAAEMVGRPITTIIPPELHEDEVRILDKLRRGERIDHFETVRLKKSGERLEVSLTISPVRDESGRVVGAAKIARDITQRKKTEDALRMSDKLATTGRLAATVAHEINNPLESVVNLVYLAKSQSGLPDNVKEYLRAAEEELDRVSQLTRQALGFYREKTAATAIHLGPIISQLRTVFSPRVTNKRIDLQVEVDQDPEIVAVPGELRQLFANLLSNSIDAVPVDGTIRVRVSHARGFNSSRQPGVRVTVADSGPGIDPAHRSRIFEPFFTTKKEVGTGLGLWVCKGIVERHGGTVRLRSNTTPGRSGTVFSVFLPANGEEAQDMPGDLLKEAV